MSETGSCDTLDPIRDYAIGLMAKAAAQLDTSIMANTPSDVIEVRDKDGTIKYMARPENLERRVFDETVEHIRIRKVYALTNFEGVGVPYYEEVSEDIVRISTGLAL